MFLCITRFNIEKQEVKFLEKFFSQEKIEIVKEKKDKKLDIVKIKLISDIKE